MVISPVALERNLNVLFNRAYTEMISGNTDYSSAMESLFTRAPSSGKSEKYGWLSDIPKVREWIGDKDYGDLSDWDYEIKNKDFYNGIAIHKNAIEDDQLGMIEPQIKMLAMDMLQNPFELIAILIRDGDVRLCYDNQPFFANRTVNDNLLAGTGTTIDQLQTDISTGRSTMMRFVTSKGKLLRITPNIIVCPPELEVKFLQIVKSSAPPNLGTNSSVVNPISGWIDAVIPLPDLTDTNDWYMFCTKFPLRPFIYQDRKRPTTVMDTTKLTSNGIIGYSAESRGNVGYAFPVLAIKFVNT